MAGLDDLFLVFVYNQRFEAFLEHGYIGLEFMDEGFLTFLIDQLYLGQDITLTRTGNQFLLKPGVAVDEVVPQINEHK